LHKFDLALQANEDEFVKRRIYLTLERGRDIALRNLLRKVLVVNGWEQPKEPGGQPVRRTRVPVAEFAAAISVGSQEKIDNDEVECLLANMIYKVSRMRCSFGAVYTSLSIRLVYSAMTHVLTLFLFYLGSHERICLPTAWNGGFEQIRRIPWHRHLSIHPEGCPRR